MKRTTISDIARKLNVSLHTVNKSLYGKKGVSEATREKIMQTAKAMNYRANRVAQSMARKPLTIGILATREWHMVSDDFKKGIYKSVSNLQDFNVSAKDYQVSSSVHSMAEISKVLKKVRSDGISALICVHVVLSDEHADFLVGNKIPFALLGTDLLENKRLTSVRTDSIMAGRLGAELMGMKIEKAAPVAVLTGLRTYKDHEDKVAGFLEEARKQGLKIAGIYEHHDKPDIVYSLVDKILEETPKVKGFYAATANSPEMCKRIVELGLQDSTTIITTDLHGEIRNYLKDGVISASIFQNCILEGETILSLIYSHLCEGKKIPSSVLIPPSVVLRNNLDAF